MTDQQQELDLDRLRVMGTPATVSLYDELVRTALIVLGQEHASVRMWSGRWNTMCQPGHGGRFSWEVHTTVGDPHSLRDNLDLTWIISHNDAPFEPDRARLRDLLKPHGIHTMYFVNNGLRVYYARPRPIPGSVVAAV